MPTMVLVLAYPTFVEIDLNEVQDIGNCNDEVQTIEYKSCSKRRISIASEYDYTQLPKAQNSVCGLQFWQSVLPLKQVHELCPDEHVHGLHGCQGNVPISAQTILVSFTALMSTYHCWRS